MNDATADTNALLRRAVYAILIAVGTGALGAISWSPLPQPVWLV